MPVLNRRSGMLAQCYIFCLHSYKWSPVQLSLTLECFNYCHQFYLVFLTHCQHDEEDLARSVRCLPQSSSTRIHLAYVFAILQPMYVAHCGQECKLQLLLLALVCHYLLYKISLAYQSAFITIYFYTCLLTLLTVSLLLLWMLTFIFLSWWIYFPAARCLLCLETLSWAFNLLICSNDVMSLERVICLLSCSETCRIVFE